MGQPLIAVRDSWRDIVHLARAHGVSARDALIIVGQMLAAAELSKPDGGDLLTLAREKELTSHDWDEDLGLAEQLWWKLVETAGDDVVRPASPFLRADRAAAARPGFFELVRQAVAMRVHQDGLLENRDAMVSACLDLASELAAASPETTTPVGVADLMVRLADLRPSDRVYCAFPGAASAALRAAERGNHTLLQLPDEQSAGFWSSLAVAARLPMWVVFADPFAQLFGAWFESAPAKFDVSLIAPPFGAKLPYPRVVGAGMPPHTSEAAGLVLAVTNARRLAICWLPAGFLFRTTALEAQFKDKAISRYGLSAVVSLPPGPAGGGAQIASALLLLEPHVGADDVLMVDHSRGKSGRRHLDQSDVEQIAYLVRRREDTGSSRVVSASEIASNQFNISPDRYVLTEEEARLQRLLLEAPSAALEELVEIYRPQAAPTNQDPLDPEISEAEAPRELSVSDLDEVGLARRPQKALPVAPTEYFKLRKAELRPGDVLLVTKGSVGRAGYVGDVPADEFWVANQSFAVLRLRRNAPIKDSRVLFRFLSSSLGQALLQRLRTGTTIPSLPMGEIKRLQVLVPTLQRQHEVANEVEALFALQAQINQLRGELEERQKTIWPDLEREDQ